MCETGSHQVLKASQISPPDDLRIAVGGVPHAASQAVKLLAKRHKQSNPEVGLRGWREGANKPACAVTASLHPTTQPNPRAKTSNAATNNESNAEVLLAATLNLLDPGGNLCSLTKPF